MIKGPRFTKLAIDGRSLQGRLIGCGIYIAAFRDRLSLWRMITKVLNFL